MRLRISDSPRRSRADITLFGFRHTCCPSEFPIRIALANSGSILAQLLRHIDKAGKATSQAVRVATISVIVVAEPITVIR